MAIASWKPIADILEANGVARDHGGYGTLDMDRFLELVKAGKRWTNLADSSAYPANKSILIDSTDVRKSNSAAMYLSLASYVANGANVVQSEAEIAQVIPLMETLFLKQGYVEYSSEAPFQDYMAMGMGKSPLVMIYESQYLYVLDVSGSMKGERLAQLKEAMNNLTGMDASLTGQFARLRNRERITIVTFDEQIQDQRDFEIDLKNPDSLPQV